MVTKESDGERSPFDLEIMAMQYGSREISLEILTNYAHQLEDQLRNLRRALMNGSVSEIHRLAHSMSGGARNIHHMDLGTAAESLERAAKTGGIGHNGETLYRHIEREVVYLAEAVEELRCGRES